MAVCSEIRIEYINTIFGQKLKNFNIKPNGTHGKYRLETVNNKKVSHFVFKAKQWPQINCPQ